MNGTIFQGCSGINLDEARCNMGEIYEETLDQVVVNFGRQFRPGDSSANGHQAIILSLPSAQQGVHKDRKLHPESLVPFDDE